MTREIKFRAWDKKRNKMYEVNNIILNQFPKEIKPKVWANLWGFDIIEQKNIILHSENLELQQFTGLQDKNGKDIYEGDILKVPVQDGEIYEVIFNDGGFTVKNIDSEKSCPASNEYLKVYAKQEEVIGNIYENTELIK